MMCFLCCLRKFSFLPKKFFEYFFGLFEGEVRILTVNIFVEFIVFRVHTMMMLLVLMFMVMVLMGLMLFVCGCATTAGSAGGCFCLMTVGTNVCVITFTH